MEEIKSVSVSHLSFVPQVKFCLQLQRQSRSWARVEWSWGQCCLCVSAGAMRAEDSGWEVEPP